MNIAFLWSCIFLFLKGVWHMSVGGEANEAAMRWSWITATVTLTVFHFIVTRRNT